MLKMQRMKPGNPKNCLICQSKNYRVIFSYDEPDQYEVAVGVGKEKYFRKWVQCRNCGFCYSVYSRDKNIIDKIYTSAYRDKNALWRGGSPEEIFRRVIALPERESETKLRVRWIKKSISDVWKHGLLEQDAPPYNVLDVGGGTGVFAYEFQDANWVVHVIDPNKDSGFIKTKLHIPLVQRYYKPGNFHHKFNLITLIYVLEHLSDPISFLKNLHNDMEDKSFLFVEVPDAICLEYKPAEDDIFNSCHLWMFGPTAITLLLSACGFEVLNLYRTRTIRGHYALMILVGRERREKK